MSDKTYHTVPSRQLDSRLRPIDSPVARNIGRIDPITQDMQKISRNSWTDTDVKSLSFSTLHGGTAILGGLDNGNGLIQVQDTSGSVVVQLDSDGAAINSGTLSAVNIVLGGVGNPGIMRILDTSGSAIGTLDANGLRITSGTLSNVTITGATYNVVSGSNLDFGSSTSAGTFSTNSFTPTGGALVLVTLFDESSTLGTVPTITGCGITWEQVGSAGIPVQNRMLQWRGMTTSPSLGSITFDTSGASGAEKLWLVDQLTNVDTSGTSGSGAYVQSVAGSTNASVTQLLGTLSAFQNASNASYVVVGRDNSTALTPSTGLTEIKQLSALSMRLASAYAANNVGTVGFTFASSSGDSDIFGAEIKALIN